MGAVVERRRAVARGRLVARFSETSEFGSRRDDVELVVFDDAAAAERAASQINRRLGGIHRVKRGGNALAVLGRRSQPLVATLDRCLGISPQDVAGE